MKKGGGYDPGKIEKKWQKRWMKDKIYRSAEDPSKAKYYVLDMFPYPSGEGLHVGHPKGYIATDVVSRYKRMNGFSVLHPMGFDAFGLPAENYALKMKMNPMDLTASNVEHFKKQLEILGFDYDWSREVNTTDPGYYKWTQWIFLQLLKKGLAYESFEPINWCPSCKTGLANEDVENGRCERCGTPVEKKPMRQWVLRITDYAERLLADLDTVSGADKPLLDWPESIKELQRNWIGRSEGALLKFPISNFQFSNNSVIPAKAGIQDHHKDSIASALDSRFRGNDKKGWGNDRVVEVFTTRPDTLFGVTYVVLAPEHKLVNELLGAVSNRAEVEAYISKAERETEIERTDAKKEKTGVELKGVKAVNPANNEKVPVWIADYVLADYGTGAVMAVPAHDERDFEFAKRYNLPIKYVVAPERKATSSDIAFREKEPIIKRNVIRAVLKHWSEDKYLVLKWNNHGWQTFISGGIEDGEDPVSAAKREILEETGYKNMEFIREIGGPIRALFYAPHKKQNRVDIQQGLLFKLKNDEQVTVSEQEKSIHTTEWISASGTNMVFNDTLVDKILLERISTGRMGAYVETGVLINSGQFGGRDSQSVMREITEFAGGKWTTTYKLRDWVFSRQRYWGEPIPVIHCKKDGVVPVPEKDLPVELPRVKSYEPTGTGESPLAAIEKWVNVKCPICKGSAKRETNTMPQWAGSSWYYLRFMDPKNKKQLVDPNKEKYWSPVDLYVGGAEHATRHLIYARFWHKFLYDLGIVSTIEPFVKLQHVGLIMGEDGRKMSKRFGNVVNPDDMVKTYGADTMRVYEMFMGPFDQQIAWSTASMVGARRFIEKVWRLAEKVVKEKVPRDTPSPRARGAASSLSPALGPKCPSDSFSFTTSDRTVHKTVRKVTEDIRDLRFNTAISALMILVNEMDKSETTTKERFEILLKLLAPFAPHVTEELWILLGNKESIHISNWPKYEAAMIKEDLANIIIQVNGKVRGSFKVELGASREKVENMAKNESRIEKWLKGKEVIKVVFVPNRLINFVLK